MDWPNTNDKSKYFTLTKHSSSCLLVILQNYKHIIIEAQLYDY